MGEGDESELILTVEKKITFKKLVKYEKQFGLESTMYLKIAQNLKNFKTAFQKDPRNFLLNIKYIRNMSVVLQF